jgi:hypothetical protein
VIRPFLQPVSDVSDSTSSPNRDRDEALQSEISAWATRTNAKQRAVDWQFTIEKTRVKLKRLYPNV